MVMVVVLLLCNVVVVFKVVGMVEDFLVLVDGNWLKIERLFGKLVFDMYLRGVELFGVFVE